VSLLSLQSILSLANAAIEGSSYLDEGLLQRRHWIRIAGLSPKSCLGLETGNGVVMLNSDDRSSLCQYTELLSESSHLSVDGSSFSELDDMDLTREAMTSSRLISDRRGHRLVNKSGIINW
jgi:hypothetical protein